MRCGVHPSVLLFFPSIYPADVRKSSSFDTNFSWYMYEMFHPSNFGRPCLCCYAHAPHFVSSAPKKLILSRKACSSQTTISISALASFLLSPACCRAEAHKPACMYVESTVSCSSTSYCSWTPGGHACRLHKNMVRFGWSLCVLHRKGRACRSMHSRNLTWTVERWGLDRYFSFHMQRRASDDDGRSGGRACVANAEEKEMEMEMGIPVVALQFIIWRCTVLVLHTVIPPAVCVQDRCSS
jgi:hypothetical protein